MSKRLAAAIACIAFSTITHSEVLGCQLAPLRHKVLPADPDAAVVFEGIPEAREDAVENGKITGDHWRTKIVRVLKGDQAILQVTQYVFNGSCGTWRPPIGGRGFMFGSAAIAPDGTWYFWGQWFSPAEAASFSWIRFGEYRGSSPYIEPAPEKRAPARSAAKPDRLSDDEPRAQRESRARAY